MSFTQLQEELKRLTSQEKLALVDFLVKEASDIAEPADEQVAELNRRYQDALAHPEKLLTEDAPLRQLKR